MSKIEQYYKEVKQKDKALVKIAINTVDNVNSDIITRSNAIDAVESLGYDDLAYYLELLDNGYTYN